MWLLCNGYWITIDCIETLLLECIIQFFDPTDTDALNLNILSIYYGRPVRFALAKRESEAAGMKGTGPRQCSPSKSIIEAKPGT